MNRAVLLASGAAMLLSLNGLAAVSLSGTRLIFDGRFQEAGLEVINRSDHEVLTQAWLSEPENVDGRPDSARADLPFVLTPHLSRLDRGARQMLRVLYQGEGMPQDRESLLHLYVLEIPRRADAANQMSIAVRQRINLFYRPAGLMEDPADTAHRLRWTLAAGKSLQVTNPTVYHAALQNVQLNGVQASDYLLLAPGTSRVMAVSGTAGAAQLSYKMLNDYGAVLAYCAKGDVDEFSTIEYRQKDC